MRFQLIVLGIISSLYTTLARADLSMHLGIDCGNGQIRNQLTFAASDGTQIAPVFATIDLEAGGARVIIDDQKQVFLIKGQTLLRVGALACQQTCGDRLPITLDRNIYFQAAFKRAGLLRRHMDVTLQLVNGSDEVILSQRDSSGAEERTIGNIPVPPSDDSEPTERYVSGKNFSGRIFSE